MSLITWDRPHPKADEPSRLDRKAQRKAEEAANWRAVCRQGRFKAGRSMTSLYRSYGRARVHRAIRAGLR